MENDASLLPTWIAAIATAATAIGAAYAWVSTLRRSRKSQTPIVEMTVYWGNDSEAGDGLPSVHVVLRNRLHEGVRLERIDWRKPRGARYADPQFDGSSFNGYKAAPSSVVSHRRELAPIGERDAAGLVHPVEHLFLAFFPPTGWNGGTVELEFGFSTMSDTFKNQRVAVRRDLPPREPKLLQK